jgi:hypothetical protein
MNLVEIMQEKDLRISFSSITGFGPLGGLSNFYHNQVAAVVLATENKKKTRENIRHYMPLKLVQSGVYFAIIQRLRSFPNRLE